MMCKYHLKYLVIRKINSVYTRSKKYIGKGHREKEGMRANR